MQYRSVICISQDTNSICTADERLKPIDRQPCNSTCGQWLVSHWSENVSLIKKNFTIISKYMTIYFVFLCQVYRNM